MATQKQIEANRKNALKSTGPKTEEGKAASSRNALKHGLAAVHHFLKHEDQLAYHETRAKLIEDWKPETHTEYMLIDTIAHGYSLMARASRVEAALFDQQIRFYKEKEGRPAEPDISDDQGIAYAMTDEFWDTAFRNLERYSNRASARYFRALETLRKLHKDRQREKEKSRNQAQPKAEPKPDPIADIRRAMVEAEALRAAEFRGDIHPMSQKPKNEWVRSAEGLTSSDKPQPEAPGSSS